MNSAQLWEHINALRLVPQGVRSHRFMVGELNIHSLVCRSQDTSSDTQSGSTLRTRVVCVHGLGASGSTYGRLLPHLSSVWREAWSPSAPRHGLSVSTQARDVSGTPEESLYRSWEQMILHLSSDGPIDLIGNSLGGAITLRFASRYPERVSRLILCSPAGARLSAEDIEHIRSVFKMSDPGDGLRFLQTLYDRAPWWAPIIGGAVQRALNTPKAQGLLTRLKPGDGLAPEELESLMMPVLLIWGGRERVLPASSLNYLLAHAPPKLELLEPAHFSHSPQQEYPAELAQLIARWLQRTESTLSSDVSPRADSL